jgi:predicted NBD/HSP70 family sugar kinase
MFIIVSRFAGMCYTDVMILAIDTGGTKTLFAEIENGQIIHELRTHTPHTPSEYVEMLRKNLSTGFNGSYTKIILDLPSDIEDGVVKATKNLFSTDFNVVEALREITDVPVEVFNDAKLAALGATTGQGREMYLTLSTGIGAGFTIDGKLSQDLNSLEVGHMIVDGQEWEAIASGRYFVEKYGRLGSEVDSGDPAWQEYAENVARGLLDVIPILRPDRIVFGGAMSLNFEKFAEPLRKILEQSFGGRFSVPELVKSQDPERAVILGAIKYAEQSF